MISEIVLTFPSQKEMISFLEKQTKSKDETSQKVIQAIAKVLANKSISAAEIGDTITLTLGIVNVKLGKIDLTQALIDCAASKEMPSKKIIVEGKCPYSTFAQSAYW